MKPVLLLVHGWGFDPGVWDQVCALLPRDDTIVWDLGFFGTPSRPAPPPGRPVIAVGHSFGFLWLLHQRPMPFTARVAINGFNCFTRRASFSAGIAPGVLTRMRRLLYEKPEIVVSEFRRTCGCISSPAGAPEIAALDAGLAGLENWDERPAIPTLALCGESDTVISPKMTRACFSDVVWHSGGHLLPLEAPEWCAAHLEKLLA